MKAMRMLVAVFGVVVLTSAAPDARADIPITTFSPDALGATCRFAGGVYAPPSPECNGCFYCLFPDGRLIYCDANGQCTNDARTIGFDGLWQRVMLLGLAFQQRLQGPADLVVLPTPASSGPEGFCRRNDQGQLLVHVYNQGAEKAGASKTRVNFANADSVDVDTPEIAAATETELVIPVPPSCYDANNECRFIIGVDATAALVEASETNNNASGLCGAQFL